MLITAIHYAGLVSLTHTPSPMGFLNTILNRPPNEKPYLLLVVGYPAKGAVSTGHQQEAARRDRHLPLAMVNRFRRACVSQFADS